MYELYGASDDLIEIRGDLSDEVYGDSALIATADGGLFRISYNPNGAGFWRINIFFKPTSSVEHHFGSDVEGDYSDRLTVNSTPDWMVVYTDQDKAETICSSIL